MIRKVLLRNNEYLYLELARIIYNYYIIPARLFIIGGKEIRLHEGTIQGDPTVMVTYAIGLKPFLDDLQNIIRGAKHLAFNDDLTDAVKLHQIKSWWSWWSWCRWSSTTQRTKIRLLFKTIKMLHHCKISIRTNYAKELLSRTNINISVS